MVLSSSFNKYNIKWKVKEVRPISEKVTEAKTAMAKKQAIVKL